jgi:hypothetical protein
MCQINFYYLTQFIIVGCAFKKATVEVAIIVLGIKQVMLYRLGSKSIKEGSC